MLKTLLLSGWFRVKPFLKYVVVVMLIAPLVASSSHATSAKQSEVIASASAGVEDNNSASIKTAAVDTDLNPELKSSFDSSLASKPLEVPMQMAAVVEPKLLTNDSFSTENNSSSTELPSHDPLSAVELAPTKTDTTSRSEVSAVQSDLIRKLKAAKNNLSVTADSLYAASNSLPAKRLESQPNTIPPASQPDAAMQEASEDPLGSAYPIPMKWITATQESMSPKGGGVRYYRSVPVISPDGRYAVYSRVQLEVKPEMHNSRVSSVLFIEDLKTKQLRVVSSTSRNSDVLINVKAEPDANREGTIGVLVPISWSEKGDRFLARRFEGVMNTSDVSDYAVVWHRDKNHTNTVGPAHQETDHEKISILLGWSKSQPNHVLFRTGEMGDENWPLVTVADDGKTASATEVDQPITFGNQSVQVWAGPQVAYR
jgi:hypothetical protein